MKDAGVTRQSHGTTGIAGYMDRYGPNKSRYRIFHKAYMVMSNERADYMRGTERSNCMRASVGTLLLYTLVRYL